MKRIVRLIVLIVGICGVSVPAVAQRTFKTDDLPSHPIDTIDTYHPEAKLILYTNNTYKYYFPNYDKLVDTPVFKDHWVQNQVFAYSSISLASLPESVELELVKDLKGYHKPTNGKVSSRYGPRRRGIHKGIDVCLTVGEPIYAVFEGRVRHAKYNSGGYGNLVIIRHPNGLETYYGHLCQLNVKVNDYVVAGQVIGYGGNTGRSSGPHLHFEVRYCDHAFDPERIIDFSTGELKWQTFVLNKKYFNARSRASDSPEEEQIEDKIIGENGEPLSSEQIVENLGGEVIDGGQEGACEQQTPSSGEAATTDNLEMKADSKAPVTPTQGGTSTSSTEAPKAPEPVYHKVVGGETLYGIARKYGTTVDKICRLNNMKSSDTLRIGKKLRVK